MSAMSATLEASYLTRREIKKKKNFLETETSNLTVSKFSCC